MQSRTSTNTALALTRLSEQSAGTRQRSGLSLHSQPTQSSALHRKQRCSQPRCLSLTTEHIAGNSEDLMIIPEEDKYYYREVKNMDQHLASAAPCDFYELLDLDLNADKATIKAAYRKLQRIVHPDLAGPEAAAVAVMLNIAYDTLMDDASRESYRSGVERTRATIGSFDGRPRSEWCGSDSEHRGVFVDETTCIGCRHCTACASNTFSIEELYGRARVVRQWGDDEDAIRTAVNMCPVDCIHFVPRDQLALLEWVLNTCQREDAAVLARRRSGNMSTPKASNDPFVKAAVFVKTRQDAQMAKANAALRRNYHDDMLAAAIATAWLALPAAIRHEGWPHWRPAVQRTSHHYGHKVDSDIYVFN